MTFSASAFYEVQALALCPANDHPNGECSVPDEGEWHTLFHLLSQPDGERTLALVMESDAEMYEKFEDFRLTKPVAKRHERFVNHEGYAWERGSKTAKRRKAASAAVAEVIPIQQGKRKVKRK